MMDNEAIIEKVKDKIKQYWGIEGEFTFEKVRQKSPKENFEKSEKLNSRDFLKFATLDYQNLDNPKSQVDCLTNCKRALVAKIDDLIDEIGLSKLSEKKNWSFKTKYELLKECGVITPKILTKVNTLRNKLEHDYQSPTKEQVEEAYELTAMFISYANSIPPFGLPQLTFGFSDELKIGLDESIPEFKFYSKENEDDEVNCIATIHHKEPEFKEFLLFFIKFKKAKMRLHTISNISYI